ncbi:MAG TPA: glycosyl hydrolase family 18 protein [Candidatus Acidoferrales bacterium]|nr:glycosyl hydrolase family 18 protein [Candidatus Acidoferrales bacterium]
MAGAPTAARPGRAGRALRLAVIGVVLTLIAGGIGWAAAGGIFRTDAMVTPTGPHGSGGPDATGDGSADGPTAKPEPTPKPPLGGTELYGYLPYWEMNDTVAAYLDKVPVDTLALFSVSAGKEGGIKHGEVGYRRITGPIGQRLIADAHARRQRVELVFTSFGFDVNDRLFGAGFEAEVRRDRAAGELLALAAQLGVDGINVDVEAINGDDNDGYATFIVALREGLAAAGPNRSLSVATMAGPSGVDLARAAIAGGADRVFLMGYDYHWAGSSAGATAPYHNRDGAVDLGWSIGAYVDAGVPRDRILLGLPLFGISWPVAGPGRAAEVTGKGRDWIPSAHADELLAPGFSTAYDQYELADYFVVQTASGWRATYYDSPRSLRPKLELARSEGLAGAGFWAIGYERGLPGYLKLMTDFGAGKIGS